MGCNCRHMNPVTTSPSEEAPLPASSDGDEYKVKQLPSINNLAKNMTIHSLTKSPTKTRPKTTQTPTFPPMLKEMVQHACHTCPSSALPEKITPQAYPVAIGTRGTVGSLIMQEIDYFSRLELGGRSSSDKPLRQIVNLASAGEFSRSKRESVVSVSERKKRGSSRLIPSMCSMVEVAESKQPNTSSGFAYRNLKADAKRSQA